MTRRQLLASLTLGIPSLPLAVRRPQVGDTIWVWLPPSRTLCMPGEWLEVLVCEDCLRRVLRDGIIEHGFHIPHPVGVLGGKFQIKWRWTKP